MPDAADPVTRLRRRLDDDFDPVDVWRLELAAYLGHRHAAAVLRDHPLTRVPPIPDDDDAWVAGLARWPRALISTARILREAGPPDLPPWSPPDPETLDRWRTYDGDWLFVPEPWLWEDLCSLRDALGASLVRSTLERFLPREALAYKQDRPLTPPSMEEGTDRPTVVADIEDDIGEPAPDDGTLDWLDEPIEETGPDPTPGDEPVSIFASSLDDFFEDMDGAKEQPERPPLPKPPEVRLETHELRVAQLRRRITDDFGHFQGLKLAAYIGLPEPIALLGAAAPERPEDDTDWVARLLLWPTELRWITSAIRGDAKRNGLALPPEPADRNVRYRSLSAPWAPRDLIALTTALSAGGVRAALKREWPVIFWGFRVERDEEGTYVPTVSEERYRELTQG